MGIKCFSVDDYFNEKERYRKYKLRLVEDEKVKRKSGNDQLPLAGKKQCHTKNSSFSNCLFIQADDALHLNSPCLSSSDANLSILSNSDDFCQWINQFEAFKDIDKVHALSLLVAKCNLTQIRHVDQQIQPLLQKDIISELPDELALYVLSFLSPPDLLTAGATCYRWRKLSEDKLLWIEKCRIAKICPNSLPPPPPSANVAIDETVSSKAVYLRHKIIQTNWRRQPPSREITLRSDDDHNLACVQINGDLILSVSGTLKLWSLSSGRCLHTLQCCSFISLCKLTEDGQFVVVANGRRINVWNIRTGLCVLTLLGHTSDVRCIALKDFVLVSGSEDKTLRVWDILTGECLHCLTGHANVVRCVVFDGRRVVSGAYDYTLKVWDVETETCIHTLAGHTNRVYSLKFDSERNIIVSSSIDNSIRVWDIANGQCLFTLIGHQRLTTCMELRDNILVSCNADFTLNVWDITTGRRLHLLAGPQKHISTITSLHIHESGLIATSSDDGTVKLWDTLTGEFVRNIVLFRGGPGGDDFLCATSTTLICAVGSRTLTDDTKLFFFDFNADYP